MTDTETTPADPADALTARVFRPGETPELSAQEADALAEAVGLTPQLRAALGGGGMSPLALKLGIRFRALTPQHAVATLPVAGNEQTAGILHGGAHLVLAETLGSVAAKLHAGPDRAVVGIEISATHHRAARSGLVTGTATALHLGGTLTTHEVVMTDDDGRRLSTVRITNMVLSPRG